MSARKNEQGVRSVLAAIVPLMPPGSTFDNFDIRASLKKLEEVNPHFFKRVLRKFDWELDSRGYPVSRQW